jgi:hypothetical protein
VVLGRALCLLGRHSTIGTIPPALSGGLLFLGRVHIFAWAGLDYEPIYISQVAGMTGAYHHAQVTGGYGGGLTKFLLRLTSNRNPPE